jgi:hypothetical protein
MISNKVFHFSFSFPSCNVIIFSCINVARVFIRSIAEWFIVGTLLFICSFLKERLGCFWFRAIAKKVPACLKYTVWCFDICLCSWNQKFLLALFNSSLVTHKVINTKRQPTFCNGYFHMYTQMERHILWNSMRSSPIFCHYLSFHGH